MVSGPRDAPGYLPASIPWFVNFFTVIIATAAALAPDGWPSIDDVTCLLTPSIALWGSQYQETDGPLQGGHRCWKILNCHHHNQFTHNCLYWPPRQRSQKWKIPALYFPMVKILSKLHENLLRYIIYRAVLPFTQLQEVSYHSWMQEGRRCWKIPYCHHHNQSHHHCLCCPPCQRRQKQKTLAENITIVVPSKLTNDRPPTVLPLVKSHSSGWFDAVACSSVNQMGRNVRLQLKMVGSGLRVPAHFGG